MDRRCRPHFDWTGTPQPILVVPSATCAPTACERLQRGVSVVAAKYGLLVYFERQSIIYVTDSRFSEGRFEGRKDVMQSVLVGIFVIFLPSILMVAWLVWQAHASGLDLDQ